MHTYTCTWPSLLGLQKSEEDRQAKVESRSIRRRGHTSQEARVFSSLMSLSQILDSSPWTLEVTVQ